VDFTKGRLNLFLIVELKMSVVNRIRELEDMVLLSKHEQLVKGIINAIDAKELVQGSMLPSVNIMVRELGFARKTIVKAYSELKDRGIIESKNRLGYFVAHTATDQTIKVALLLYAFHTFQEVFYNTFREVMGENAQIDVFFHHNNFEVYEQTLTNIADRYGIYVVAPISHKKNGILLRKIPPNKLLIVDRYEQIGGDYSYVSQHFEAPTYQMLELLKERLKDFEELVLFFKHDTDYPLGIFKAFETFTKKNKFKSKVLNCYSASTLKKGKVYFTIGDIDLWELLKDCKKQNIKIGEEVGIISHNDSPAKEIICGGITTISTDFALMGKQAAEFVTHRKKIQQIVPSTLLRRASL